MSVGGYRGQRTAIEQRALSAPHKRVLLVEGSTDLDFLAWMLDKPPYQQRNAEARWLFAPAGGKEVALRMLSDNPHWHALVDRDAWSGEECERARAEHPGLMILPRFCLENYLIEPEVLWDNLTSSEKGAMPGGRGAFVETLNDALPQAVRHGALWRVAQPLYDGLRNLGFNDALLEFDYGGSAEDVLRVLSSWHDYLNPQPLIKAYERHLQRAGEMDKKALWRTWVHGKYVWRKRVLPLLYDLSEKKPEARMRELFRKMPLPRDLAEILDFLFAEAGR